MVEEEAVFPVLNLGDVIDKMSILTRKLYFGEEEVISEHRYLEKGLEAFGVQGKLISYVMKITQINFEIWNQENEIRNGGEDRLGLEEVGRRALRIRDLNKKRINYKNDITAWFNTGFKEVKIHHRSQ